MTLLEQIKHLTYLKNIISIHAITDLIVVKAYDPVADEEIQFINLAADRLPPDQTIKSQIKNIESEGANFRGVIVYFSDSDQEKNALSRTPKRGKGKYTVLHISHLLKSVLRTSETNSLYKDKNEKWRESEALKEEKFHYIRQMAENQEQLKTLDLETAIDMFIQEEQGGCTLIYGESGMGKTSFCKSYAYNSRIDLDNYPIRIPLIFFLNDFRAGDFKTYITGKLWDEYKYKMDFPLFVSLCQAGFFVIILDAFDQMVENFGQNAFERDFGDIKKLFEGHGKLILTSRSARFMNHIELSIKEILTDRLVLSGFDKTERDEYFKGDQDIPAIIEKLAASDPTGILCQKPLILRLIKINKKAVQNLLSTKEEITEFNLIQMSYRQWEDNFDKTILKSVNLFFRIAVQSLSDNGLNRRFPLKDICKKYETLTSEAISVEKLVMALEKLMFFDAVLLRNKDNPELVFIATPYLEMLVATFVMEELEKGRSFSEKPPNFSEATFLSRETRHYLLPHLTVSEPEILEGIVDLINGSKEKEALNDLKTATNLVSLLFMKYTLSAAKDKPFFRKKIGEIKFQNLKLEYADFQDLDLAGFDLMECNLRHSDLSHTRLRETDLERSDLFDLWHEEKGDIITTAFIHPDKNGVRFSGGTKNGILVTWEEATQKLENNLILQGTGISQVMFADSTHIILATDSNQLYKFDFSTREKSAIAAANNVKLKSVCTLKNGEIKFAGTTTGKVLMFTNEKKAAPIDLPDETSWVTSLVKIPDQDRILAACAGGRIFSLDENKRVQCCFRQESLTLKKIRCISADTCIVLTKGNQLLLVDLDNSNKYRELTTALDFDYCSGLSRIFFLDGNRAIKSYGINEKEFIEDFFCIPGMRSIAVTEDGGYVAIAGESLQIFKQETGLSHKYIPILSETMRMDCSRLKFDKAKNVDQELFRFFMERGAELPTSFFLKNYFDFEINDIDRFNHMFICKNIYCENNPHAFEKGFVIKNRQLYCQKCGESYE